MDRLRILFAALVSVAAIVVGLTFAALDGYEGPGPQEWSTLPVAIPLLAAGCVVAVLVVVAVRSPDRREPSSRLAGLVAIGLVGIVLTALVVAE